MLLVPAAAVLCACQVRVLLSSGGEYEELEPTSGGSGSRSARWRYVGGETRLVGLHATSSYSDFLLQLSTATSTVWDEVRALRPGRGVAAVSCACVARATGHTAAAGHTAALGFRLISACCVCLTALPSTELPADV